MPKPYPPVFSDAFFELHNQRRPHRSLPHRATPATAYQARPKATLGTRSSDTHDRIRYDRIDDSGVVTLRVGGGLHHIGIGRTHARTQVLMLIQDHPNRDYQPTGPTRGERDPTQLRVRSVPDLLRDHRSRASWLQLENFLARSLINCSREQRNVTEREERRGRRGKERLSATTQAEVVDLYRSGLSLRE